MEISSVAHIIDELDANKCTIVDASLRHIWTAHYNEILLYKYFGEFINLLRDRKYVTSVLSNGTTILPRLKNLVDGISSGVIVGVCLNIPSIIREDWIRYTNMNNNAYDAMVRGVSELVAAVPQFISSKQLSIVVHGVDDAHKDQRGYLSFNAPKIPCNDLDAQLSKFKDAFPTVNIYKAGGLHDRGGHLTKLGVMNHTKLFTSIDAEVVGCKISHEMGGRPLGWLHINAIGEVFICCCDYLFEYTFGNILQQDLKSIWEGSRHAEVVSRAYSGICRTCCNAKRTT